MKSKYTQKDLDELEFHDCSVIGQFYDEENKKFYLDIDYITRWLQKGKAYNFEISPATLVFNNVSWLQFEHDSTSTSGFRPTIDSIQFEEHENSYGIKFPKYNIECWNGCFVVFANGFELYLRERPKLYGQQYIPLIKRGGVSFSLKSF